MKICYPLFVVLLLVVLMTGCQKRSSTNTTTVGAPGQQAAKLKLVETVSLASGEASKEYSVNVPEGSVSLSIIADGQDASDIDISSIIDPTGKLLVTSDPDNDPIGPNWAQGPGSSVASFTIPHSNDYDFLTGTWRFIIKHFESSDGQPRDVSIYTSVKPNKGSIVNLNVFLVALDDYTGEGDVALASLLQRVGIAFGFAGIGLGDVNIVELTSVAAQGLTVLDLAADTNFNGWSDDMDQLLAMSSTVNNDYINLFLIKSFSIPGVLGISGGIPGPPLLQGTPHSGTVVSTFGGLQQIYPKFIQIQGDTIVHELGHYLGLFHTSERSGADFDQFSDTPECPANIYDTNLDGLVSAKECQNLDGPNLMFWAASKDFNQNAISGGQKFVLSVNPAVK